MKHLTLLLPALVASLATAHHADAAMIINFTQSGSDVIAFGEGSINLGGLTRSGGLDAFPQSQAGEAIAILGSIINRPVDFYTGTLSGPISFGPGVATTFASSGTGDTFGILGLAREIVVPRGYVSGTFLTAVDSFTNRSFSSLGLIQGTYRYSFGSGATADTITVQVGSNVVPEPASLALAGVGLLAVGLICRKRRPTR